MSRQRKRQTGFEMIMKLKDPDQIFDLVCSANYFAGQFNNNIPVDDSRKAFERIKELLKSQ
jgi:allantoicase